MTLKAYKLSVFYSTCHDINTEKTNYGMVVCCFNMKREMENQEIY